MERNPSPLWEKEKKTLVSKIKADVFEQPEFIPPATSLEITGVSISNSFMILGF